MADLYCHAIGRSISYWSTKYQQSTNTVLSIKRRDITYGYGSKEQTVMLIHDGLDHWMSVSVVKQVGNEHKI